MTRRLSGFSLYAYGATVQYSHVFVMNVDGDSFHEKLRYKRFLRIILCRPDGAYRLHANGAITRLADWESDLLQFGPAPNSPLTPLWKRLGAVVPKRWATQKQLWRGLLVMSERLARSPTERLCRLAIAWVNAREASFDLQRPKHGDLQNSKFKMDFVAQV